MNAVLQVNNVPTWPVNATLTLIAYRRRYHPQFENRSIRDHTAIWTRIANRIFQRNNFLVIAQQCKTKWTALKRGYENLRRMFDGNPHGYPVHSPNSYDTRFYNELSDEFWLETNRYQRIYRRHRAVDRRTYEYRERRHSRSRSRSRCRHSSSRSPSRSRSRSRNHGRRRHRRNRSHHSRRRH